jgi:hypothetical protein
MITKYKNLGTALSKDEMKKVKGGYVPCQPPVCSGEVCPSCKYHCEWDSPLSTHCVRNGSEPEA